MEQVVARWMKLLKFCRSGFGAGLECCFRRKPSAPRGLEALHLQEPITAGDSYQAKWSKTLSTDVECDARC